LIRLSHRSTHSPSYVTQTTGTSRILDLAGTTSGFDLPGDHLLSCRAPPDFDLGPNARNRVVEAIADRTFIVSLLEVNGDSQLVFFKLNLAGIIDNGTIAVATEFIFVAGKLGCLDIGSRHGANRGERYTFTFLTAPRTEDYIFPSSFARRTTVR